MKKRDNGGPAFPCEKRSGGVVYEPGVGNRYATIPTEGMTLRDYFAARAPIEYEVVIAAWGDDSPRLTDDRTRAAFFAVWALLRYEWADAMLAQRSS